MRAQFKYQRKFYSDIVREKKATRIFTPKYCSAQAQKVTATTKYTAYKRLGVKEERKTS